jgi:hypothetical protein
MDSKENIPISRFGPHQADILFKRLVLQNLCPRKFLIEDPWLRDELDEDDVETVRAALRELMPLDTIVTDMWDWDLHFEDTTFEDTYFDVAFGPEDFALAQAECLKEDLLLWMDEYGMDYAQEQRSEEEFEQWIHDQCKEFIRKWRSNIVKRFASQEAVM